MKHYTQSYIDSNLKFEDYLKEVNYEINSSFKGKSLDNPNEKTESLHINTKPGKYYNTYKDYSSSSEEFGGICKFHKKLRLTRDKVELTDFEVRKELTEIMIRLGITNTNPKLEPKKKDSVNADIIKFKYPSEQLIFGMFRKAVFNNTKSSKIASRKAHRCTLGARKKNNNRIFRFILQNSEKAWESKKALGYLSGKTRLLDKKTIKKFNLHYIEDATELNKKLRNNFEMEELEICGLFKDGKSSLTDNFIIIPFYEDDFITTIRFRSASETVKIYRSLYSNVEESTSKRLLNYNVLKILEPSDNLFITESEFDSMVLTMLGYKAMSCSGTSTIPFESLKEIKHKNTIYVFDNDSSGDGAIPKICNKLMKPISYLQFYGVKDVTEYYGVSNGDILNSNYAELKVTTPTFKDLQDNFDPLKTITAVEFSKRKVSKKMWIVDDILPTGLTILSARPKAGKGYLALTIANSIVNKHLCFGEFKTEQVGVYYVTYEESAEDLIPRLNQIGNVNEKLEYPVIDQPIANGKKEIHPYFKPLDKGGLDDLKILLEDRKDIRFIIVDTLSKAFSSSNSNNYDYKNDYKTIGELQAVANFYSVAILALHHSRKTPANDPIDMVLGSTGITAAATTIYVLSNKSKNNIANLYMTGRRIKERTLTLKMNEDSGIWEKAEQEHSLTPEQDSVFECIKSTSQESIRTSEIAKSVGLKEQSVSRILKVLVNLDLIVKPKYGHYKIKEKTAA